MIASRALLLEGGSGQERPSAGAKVEDRTAPESESEQLPLRRPSRRRSRPRKRPKRKKSESLNAWPEPENEEEVETFNLSKKS